LVKNLKFEGSNFNIIIDENKKYFHTIL
jgi:hypothetical protein